ncbi:hypothetical protein E2320_003640, partial [Naja naja]
DIYDRTPCNQRLSINSGRRKSPSPRRGRVSKRENDRNNSESVNGFRDIDPIFNKGKKGNYWLLDSRATSHTSCVKELFTSFTKMSFNIKIANQNSEVLFIPETPYNVLATVTLSKGAKIEVLFKDGNVLLTNNGKEVGNVVLSGGLPYYIPYHESIEQINAGFSNKDEHSDGVEEKEREENIDDNCNTD